MKFYKRLSLNQSNPFNNNVAYEIDGQVRLRSTNSLEIPSGTSEQRPANPVTGSLRYNSTLNFIESYTNGTWSNIVNVGTARPISIQTFSNGNYDNTVFGPLTYSANTSSPQTIFVYVDNVYQIPFADYTLKTSTQLNESSPTATVVSDVSNGATTIYLNTTTNFEVGMQLTGTGVTGSTITNSDTVLDVIEIYPPATQNISSGTVITATYNAGTYISFTVDAVPVPSQPITVLQGFDGSISV